MHRKRTVTTNKLAPAGIEALYVDHQPWLHAWLRRKLGDGSQAQDLVQDTFVQLICARHLPALDNPRAYLTTVAQRTLFAFWRRRDLERAYLDALAAQPMALQPSEEDRYAIVQALQAVDRVLCTLPHTTRQVLLLAQLEELTYPQIAQRLGVAEITVRRHMARAIEACCDLSLAGSFTD